ncbi:MAG: hypothetical protein ACLVAW_02095 [Eisenbergiella massiliensis]
MKRLGAVLLSAAMVLSLTACGGNTTTAPAASNPPRNLPKRLLPKQGTMRLPPLQARLQKGQTSAEVH